MTFFEKVTAGYRAMEYGQQLANAHAWADRATAISLLTAFLTAAVGLAKGFGYDLHLEGTDISAIALGLATVGCTISNFMHVAANEQAGKVRNKSKR